MTDTDPGREGGRVWRLKPMSFVGIVAGATHHMGDLYPPDERANPHAFGGKYGYPPEPIAVEAELDAKTARALSTYDYTYHAGVACERFLSRDAMEAAAVAQFLALAEPGDVLQTYFTERVITAKLAAG